MRAASKASLATTPVQLLEGHVRGFCTSKEGKDELLAFGLTDKEIYQRGLNGENLEHCLITFWGRPGWIVLPEDIRAFGDSKVAVAEQCTALEKAGIQIRDLSQPEHTTYSEHQQFAQVKISGARFLDKRKARRTGRRGGIGKGIAAIARRHAQMADEYISRIVNHRALTWAIKAELLKGIASISSLRRHFYNPDF